LSSSLRYLVASYEQRGQYDLAQNYARKQIEIEPWDELAHQQLMRSLALSGQRSAALVQFESCRHLLAEELGVEPTRETTQLYEQIRTGKLHALDAPPVSPTVAVTACPAFLVEETPQIDTPIFVARELELEQLAAYLDQAMTGPGRAAFVTGESGSGKTALLQEFSQRSQENHIDLVVATGNCNAYTGIGDPYLPFREILEQLTGDVEAKWAAGAITSEHALRLWDTVPVAFQAIAETGHGLIETFISRPSLVERVLTYKQWPGSLEWLTSFDVYLENKPFSGPYPASMQQSDLFEQYTKVLQVLAQQRPLLLVVDDLQWADQGSLSLLFHLGRSLEGSRIMLVGAYRPEEVALGRDGKRHPLSPVVSEFKLEFGDIFVNVDQAERRKFVGSFLDSQPNRLGNNFRELLYQRTRGHPLFTIELLRGMQERGDLIQDSSGWWAEGQILDWETLPARVEAAIAERVDRLAKPLRDALRVASVEGEDFTAEVVARVLGTDEREMVSQLSSQLDRRHHLIRPKVIKRPRKGRVSRYRFRNYLFQKYLYDSLDQVERTYLHEDVGDRLEEAFGDQASEIAVQLAWHFQEAGVTDKAIVYLRLAGEKAAHLSAYQEGITHLNKAMTLLMKLPDSNDRNEQELALQLALGMAWQGVSGPRTPEFKQAYTRAYDLCQQVGNRSQLCLVLGEMVESYFVGGEYKKAHELAEESLSLAEEAGDPMLLTFSHWYMGFTLFALGKFAAARSHLGQVIDFYNPHEHHHGFVSLRGKDAGLSAMAYDACCLWCLGYPVQAAKRSRETLRLARELDHPFSLAEVLCFAGCLLNEMGRDAAALKMNAEAIMQLSAEKVHGWRGVGNRYFGEAQAMLGQGQEGIKQIRKGLEMEYTFGICSFSSGSLGALAEAQVKDGYPEEALDSMAEAFAFVGETDECYWEAELHRQRANILLTLGKESEAEISLQNAVQIAQHQHARSLEIRAATALARLWQKQDRTQEAQDSTHLILRMPRRCLKNYRTLAHLAGDGAKNRQHRRERGSNGHRILLFHLEGEPSLVSRRRR
jgi:tetratricopeptide (TPR) repeat protein